MCIATCTARCYRARRWGSADYWSNGLSLTFFPKADSNAGYLLDSLQVILERMAPYFPFLPNPLVRRDVQASIYFDLHLRFAYSYPPRIRSSKHYKILTLFIANSRHS